MTTTTSIYGIPVTLVDERILRDVLPKQIWITDQHGQSLTHNETPYMLPDGQIVWLNTTTYEIDEPSRMKCFKYLADKALESLRQKPEIKFEQAAYLNETLVWRVNMRYNFNDRPLGGSSYLVGNF